MKNIKMLSARRLNGLFASIIENGAMVSLAGRWVYLNDLKGQNVKNLEQRVVEKRKLVDGKYETKQVTMYRTSSLADLIMGFSWRILFAIFPNKVKISSRLRVVKLFSGHIYRMYKNHGDVTVVKFLKAAQLAVQKAIAKDVISSLSELEPSLFHTKLTGFGLPRMIPSRDRKLINAKHLNIIRFWLTLFSVYRVISIPGNLKLTTIVDGLTVSKDKLENVNLRLLRLLDVGRVSSMFSKRILMKPGELLLPEAASSTHKVSWVGMFTDPQLLASHELLPTIRQIMVLCGQSHLVVFMDTLNSFNEVKILEEGVVSEVENPYKGATILDTTSRYVGKLSIKTEAAGKERVFAMVDFWTQQALKPIHAMLFDFLRDLPNDGTFDQGASVKRAAIKAQYYRKSFGYDLSAATDRLPLALQSSILNYLLPGLGPLWAKALTDRGYYLMLPDYLCKELGIPVTKRDKEAMLARVIERKSGNIHIHAKYVPTTMKVGDNTLPILYTSQGKPYVVLRYNVGQPMGALSSWAMLAVTHHLIVQLAFRQAYNIPEIRLTSNNWYDDYELLGDDIILFDEKVATQYLILMEEIGVPINTSKSVCAKAAVAEFAKVTTLDGTDVSALSWKMFMSGNSFMGRANIAFFLLNKGYIKEINKWFQRFTIHSLTQKGLSSPSYLAIWSMLSNRKLITVEEALSALVDGTQKVFKLGRAILLNCDVNRIKAALPALLRDGTKNIFSSKKAKAYWNIERPWMGIHLWKPLAVFSAKADVDKDMQKLAIEMLSNWVAFKPELLPAENRLVIDLSVNADKETNDQIVLFSALYVLLMTKAERLVSPIIGNQMQIDSSPQVLADGREVLDRYNELLALNDRAQIKMDPDADVLPSRIVRPTELKLISMLRKMGSRPLFTTAYNL